MEGQHVDRPLQWGVFRRDEPAGPSVFIGESLVPGGIEFLPTDMSAVDASGKPTGKTLYIARTPHTNGARDCINEHLLVRGETHGSMVMHEDGTAYVVERGATADFKRIPRTPVMDPGHGFHTVHSVKHDIPFYPNSSLIMADPNFATHPAVHMTWYESASQAAAIEDADPRFRIRMMRDPEYTRFVTWDNQYTEAQVKERAHLYRDGITGTASVTGTAAALRTTEEGFVDPFGNVWIWTDGVNARPATGADMDTVTRVLRGASWDYSTLDGRVGKHNVGLPSSHDHRVGVRWVAIRRP